MKSDAPSRILVVDDEPQVRNLIASILRNDGYYVETAESGEQACAILEPDDYDLVFTDLQMAKGTGLDVLRHMQKKNLRALGIVVTGYGTFDSAIEALRMGAFDYLTKPVHLDEIRQLSRKALEVKKSRAAAAATYPNFSVPAPSRPNRIRSLVGKSDRMRALNTLIATVANSSSTVLIQGESGTGKELVARALHNQSPRAEKPLIPVNCGAIPEDLLESELFGHIKGSFTGATNDRVGRFVLADGGTIFLDEIGDMSPKLQVKVLRVLQEQEVEPVGSAETVKVNVRVLAATNVDLEKAVNEKRFREDLYYRLNVIPIIVPPLRERLEDIPLLVDYFIKCFNQRHPRKLDGFAPETFEILRNYSWRGNVRELENLVERMSVLSKSPVVMPSDLPEKFHSASISARAAVPVFMPAQKNDDAVRRHSLNGAPGNNGGASEDRPPENVLVDSPFCGMPVDSANLSDLVDRFERDMIIRALEKSNGVKNRAAQILGIKRTTLVEKMKKKNIVSKRNLNA